MEKVKRRPPRSRPWLRRTLLICAAAVLVGAGIGWALLGRRAPVVVPETVKYSGEIISRTPGEVARVEVTLRDGGSWALRQEDGVVTMEGDDSFLVDSSSAQLVLNAASIISYNMVLTEEAADYADRLSEFGLDAPSCVVRITYSGGEDYTLRIGDKSQGDDIFYYMTIDGDDRLFAADAGTVEELRVDRYLLHAVTQPVIHASRLDRVTLEREDSVLSWALQGSISDPDAIDRWVLTEPLLYPADGERMDSLLSQLESLRLGAYVLPATEENLTACGFDAPRLIIRLHMAQGTTGTVSGAGVYDVSEWPESELTLTVGGTYAELIDYVRYEDGIYLMSRVSLSALLSAKAADTLNRYPVLTTLSNLSRLTITDAEGERVYQVTRTQQDAGDGTLETVSSVTLNGEALSWAAFENAYAPLLLVTVSGTLPEGWTADEAPHTVYRFETLTGADHTLALVRWDAMHDALLVDGSAVFYLIRDALAFRP